MSKTLISFPAAARLLPRPVHRATLHRWADDGLGGVKLWSTWIGGRRFTTDEALAEFLAEVDSRRYLQDQFNREQFERVLAEKFGLTKPQSSPDGPAKGNCRC